MRVRQVAIASLLARVSTAEMRPGRSLDAGLGSSGWPLGRQRLALGLRQGRDADLDVPPEASELLPIPTQ
jgi:hypothetical protein